MKKERDISLRALLIKSALTPELPKSESAPSTVASVWKAVVLEPRTNNQSAGSDRHGSNDAPLLGDVLAPAPICVNRCWSETVRRQSLYHHHRTLKLVIGISTRRVGALVQVPVGALEQAPKEPRLFIGLGTVFISRTQPFRIVLRRRPGVPTSGTGSEVPAPSMAPPLVPWP